MERRRVALLVYVDLDMLPGTMHTPESAEMSVSLILNGSIPHYRPKVEIAQKELQPEERLKNAHVGYREGHISDRDYLSIINRVNPE